MHLTMPNPAPKYLHFPSPGHIASEVACKGNMRLEVMILPHSVPEILFPYKCSWLT